MAAKVSSYDTTRALSIGPNSQLTSQTSPLLQANLQIYLCFMGWRVIHPFLPKPLMMTFGLVLYIIRGTQYGRSKYFQLLDCTIVIINLINVNGRMRLHDARRSDAHCLFVSFCYFILTILNIYYMAPPINKVFKLIQRLSISILYIYIYFYFFFGRK